MAVDLNVWQRWRLSMLLYGVSMVCCGAFAAALLLTPRAQTIDRAHQRGYDEAMARPGSSKRRSG